MQCKAITQFRNQKLKLKVDKYFEIEKMWLNFQLDNARRRWQLLKAIEVVHDKYKRRVVVDNV